MELKEIYRLATQGAYKEYKDAEAEMLEHPGNEYCKAKEQEAWDKWMKVTVEWMEMIKL